jgi:hypothetical protein
MIVPRNPPFSTCEGPCSLSDLKNRSEKVTGRGQILTILKANSRSIARKSGEICTVQTLLQPISFKSDRLLDVVYMKQNQIENYDRNLCMTRVETMAYS